MTIPFSPSDGGSRAALQSTVSPHALLVGADKGGVGKTTLAEIISIVLEDMGVEHSVAEVEADERLGRRLGDRVQHHRLHGADAKALARDPDALNVFWDSVYGQVMESTTLGDFGANALALFLRWASSRSVRAALADGSGLHFALVATSDSDSLTGTLASARAIAANLPKAQTWLIFNEVAGGINLQHPGIAQLIREARCQQALVLPSCRAPDFGILKNLGRLDRVALISEADLGAHGIPRLRAGRALEGLQDWLLEVTEVLRPMVEAFIARRG
ncbi:hypothetical protein [Falsiroseomonas sp. CW058]|uniref:hypothetical protein n=1 Tax=Falsiroseomonas sp. CW058 TaxID=3388664 RepID=UPI003D3221EA